MICSAQNQLSVHTYTDGLTVTELEGSSYRKTVIVLQDSQSFSKQYKMDKLACCKCLYLAGPATSKVAGPAKYMHIQQASLSILFCLEKDCESCRTITVT